MHDAGSFAGSLELTERAKTPLGPMRIMIGAYPSGALRVELRPEVSDMQDTPNALEISADTPDGDRLAQGEFSAICPDTSLRDALLGGGQFRFVRKGPAGSEVWGLGGLANIEFLSAFTPPVAASKASYPAHLFDDLPFDADRQRALAATFETQGYTNHSVAGRSIWMIKAYCEKKKVPFAIYLLEREGATTGILFCRKELASSLREKEEGNGCFVQTVYESPIDRNR